MNSKKAITLLVLLSMLFSMVPVTFGSLAGTLEIKEQETPYGVVTQAQVGDDLSLTGSGVTAGQDVRIYWDLVQAWSSATKSGLLNASIAEASGDFDVWFEIPEATIGDHYVWAKDMDTGETDKIVIEILPSASGSSSSGLEGDKVDVAAKGFNDETDLAFLLIDDAGSPETTVPTYKAEDIVTTETDYEFTLTHTLIVPGTVSLSDGTTTWTDAAGDGVLVGAGPPVGAGTVDYLTGEVTLEYGAAPAADADLDADYDYYVNDPDAVYVFTSGLETNDFGSVTKRCTIPDETTEMGYGTYLFLVYDGDGNSSFDTFSIGAVITIDVEEGPVGTVVEIRGSGFDPAAKIGDVASEVVITDGATPVDCAIIDVGAGIEIDAGGDFKLEVVIPSVDMDDYDEIEVTDGAGNTASVDFTVTGEAKIEVSPEYGVQGTKITVHGWNFTAIDNEALVLKLYTPGDPDVFVVDVKDFETDNDGEFSGTFTVPARTSDTYVLKAEQEDWDILAETDFRIGMMIVILSPNSGPTGSLVTITGTGFSDGGDWNATFGDLVLIDDGDVDGEGNLGVGDIPTFYVPTVDPGVYTLTILDIDTEIEVEVEFTVTETTMLELDPIQAPQDYNVTFMGKYFAADDDALDDVTLEWVLWNETDDWDMDVFQMWDHDDNELTANVERVAIVNDEGNFSAYWDFNDGDIELDVGTYWINVTDSEDLFAQFEFKVVSKTTDIEPRKSAFSIGDTVAFNIESSFAQDNSYIKVWDPSGKLYWRTDDFIADVWLKVETIERVPYYEQVAGGNPMNLLDDAPLGTWEWTWYDADDDVLDDGAFTVEAADTDVIGQQVADLNNQITELADQLGDVTAEFTDVKSDIADVAAIAEQAVTAAQAAAEAVQTVAQTANTASEAAANAATAAEAARDAANGLTTLVYGAIGAALVAALAAIVSLMQISRRIAG